MTHGRSQALHHMGIWLATPLGLLFLLENICMSPTNKCSRISLGFSHTYQPPSKEDIRKVGEFFECIDSRLGWYLRSYKGHWTRF